MDENGSEVKGRGKDTGAERKGGNVALSRDITETEGGKTAGKTAIEAGKTETEAGKTETEETAGKTDIEAKKTEAEKITRKSMTEFGKTVSGIKTRNILHECKEVEKKKSDKTDH